MPSMPGCAERRARKPKLDWRKIFPLAVNLYHDGLTVPKIHENLQSKGFDPSLRTVYNKLNGEGYPTCHGRQPKSQPAASIAPAEIGDISEYQQQHSLVPLSESVTSMAPICLPVRSHTQLAASNVSSTQPVGTPSNRVADVCVYGSPASQYLQSNPMEEVFTGNVPVYHEERTAKANSRETMTGSLTPNRFPSMGSKTDQVHAPKKRKVSNITEAEILQRKPQENAALFLQTGGRTRHAHWAREDTVVHRKYKHLRSLMSSPKSKNEVSKNQAGESSLFSDNDSGYYSGKKSQSALSMRDSLVSYPGSLTGVQELYRVECLEDHEHKDREQYGEELPCSFCGFASIHGLALSATRLKLEDFVAGLSLKEIYDSQAIDAAGNSALHYAAISGAGADYLAALIDAGVPLYQRNTGGQNFLHCLRPCYIESYSPDCFDLGLIRLLELVEPKKMFGQRDNYGQAVLHVIALYATDPELKVQILKKFSESDHLDIFLDRFGNYPMLPYEGWRREQPISEEIDDDRREPSQDPIWWNETVNYPDEMASDAMRPSPLDFEASERGEISSHPPTKVCDNPHFIYSETEDTTLHVLSRLNVQPNRSSGTTEMIRCLKNLVAHGVNLNWYNKEGQTPLTAFICNQSLRGDETGATLAKYMNILIGNDGKRNSDTHGNRDGVNIDMMNRRGATALHEACVGAHFAVVCSLIQAGANVNARLCNDPNGLSVLQATYQERAKMIPFDPVRHSNFGEIISELELNGAVRHPTMLDERGWHKPST